MYANEVKVRAVPHIEGLRVDDMLWFIENKCPHGVNYLPNDYRKRSLNRDWLANLCIFISLLSIGNTLNEADFKLLIDSAIKEREQYILKNKSLEFQVDPRIVKAVEKSSMLSSNIFTSFFNLASKGRSHLLLRDLEEEKTVKGLKRIKNQQSIQINEAEDEIEKLRKEISLLQSEIDQRDCYEKEEEKHRQLLSDLYEKGIIDEDGNYVDVNKNIDE